MDQENVQQAKEKAVLLALQKNMALIRRGLEIYGMRKDGSTILITKTSDHNSLWQEALRVLEER